MEQVSLLPCPFCGGQAIIDHHEGYGWWSVMCNDCHATTSEMQVFSASQAADKWNRRTHSASPDSGKS